MPAPPPIATCGSEALEFCDPPVPGRSDVMGEADAEDDANRDLWLQCINRHRGAVLCLRRIRAVGGMQVEEVRDP